MSDKNKDLMNPRFEVIADYPNSTRIVGQTLTAIGNEEGIDLWCAEFDKYPHLFRKLQWWERRSIEELPEYLKCIQTVSTGIIEPDTYFKVVKWYGYTWGKAGEDIVIVLTTDCYIPATESDYLTYQKQKDGK